MMIETFTTDELMRYAGVHAATPLEKELLKRLEEVSDEYDTLERRLEEVSDEYDTLERRLERISDILED